MLPPRIYDAAGWVMDGGWGGGERLYRGCRSGKEAFLGREAALVDLPTEEVEARGGRGGGTGEVEAGWLR